MIIRPAKSSEAGALTALALEAKRYWGYPDHWIERWKDDLTVSPDYLASNQVNVAEEHDQIVGFYALLVQGDKAELDHLWVAPEHIGSGVGKQLFLHAMQNASEQNIGTVAVLADPNAEGFYLKMGAYKIGEEVTEIDGQPRVLPRLTVSAKKS
ncbi:MAG TPA: GNAT family N-acetyltransferase [Pyrinomonadaceae bacterium]|nr:GNAT family N-acetyltransferase [Pyrinomonadaceae bacterium]